MITENKKQIDYWKHVSIFLNNAYKPLGELYYGFKSNTIPLGYCLLGVTIFELLFYLKLDHWPFIRLHIHLLYPRLRFFYIPYYYFWVLSPFWGWGVFRAALSQRLTNRLAEIFRGIGLQNKAGALPNLVCDVPIDSATRKLRLTRAALPLSDFQKVKSALESALHVFIDEIKEDRIKGTIDVIYSHSPMLDSFEVKNYQTYHSTEVIVGTTRSKIVRANLTTTPHFLIAGQTGGGKSTFLRHFITSLYLSDKSAHFTLIDLKGGLEFQTFENLKRMQVRGDIASSIAEFKEIDQLIDGRMKLLKANQCKDIAQYLEKPLVDRKTTEGIDPSISLHRHIIVVDEAAELFLTNGLAAPDEVRKAKEILSRVSRQGRSLGIHLIVATQCPDSRALDPQIKANLPGVLSFQMANDTSSIAVLGNGRATDLPPIPGRGIYKNSLEMVEVQTPFLPTDRAEEMLKSGRIPIDSQKGDEAHQNIEPQNGTPLLGQDASIKDKLQGEK